MAGSYDFEEQERIAELKAWWEDNRWFVAAGIVVAIVVFAGYRGYRWYTAKQAEDAAAAWAPVNDALKEKDTKKTEATAKVVIEKYPGSFQASEAALILARLAFEDGKLDEARKQLEWVLANGSELHRGIARMRLASVLLEQKKYDEALRLLDGNKDEAYIPLAANLRGDVMLAQNRIDEARAAYKSAVDKSAPGDPVKSIAQTKLNALGGDK